ncbi:hypothetical protein ACIRPZ_23310 [Streptomyces anulatus]
MAGRRYCDAACRAQAYRERRAAERMFGIAVFEGLTEADGLHGR